MTNLSELYLHFDQLAEQDASADDLFASSYIRGFIALVASEFGDESQPLSNALAERVAERLIASKNELTPADQTLVQNYWAGLSANFS